MEKKNSQASLERTLKISELKDLMVEYFEREDKVSLMLMKDSE